MTKWIDWHPKAGDVRPERYRYYHKPVGGIRVGWTVTDWLMELKEATR